MPSQDRRSAAETVALQTLAWLAETDDMLAVFLRSSGLDAADLGGLLNDPEFLAAVLDFVLMDEKWVLAASAAAGLAPLALLEARRDLPGGELPEWT